MSFFVADPSYAGYVGYAGYYAGYAVVSAVCAAAALLLVYVVQNEAARARARIRGLPGPRGWPVVGSLFQTTAGGQLPAEMYRRWAAAARYGAVFQVSLGNRPAVVVNTAAAARALFLGQRMALNSRPTFYVFHGKVSTTVTSIGTSPWDESCRRRRKAAAGALNRVRVAGYAPILEREAREFVRELGQAGDDDFDFRGAVRRFALNLSLTLNYGTRVASVQGLAEDPLMAEIVYVEGEISKLRDTARNYANYIPLLRWLDRFPWTAKKNSDHAADIGRRRLAYNARLLDRLRDEVARGVDQPCIQGAVLRDPEAATALTEEELLSVSLSMMAGADSNQPTLAWTILLLAHRQDVQAKAYQAICDASCRRKATTTSGSQPIPYLTALTREINRYFTVLRLALPKATTTEATWGNATIPANTLVFLNSWACNRDPALFTDPETFAPERWLPGSPDEQAHQFAFGIGGRMCVASHLAHNALYTVFLHLVAHFAIFPAEGTTAQEIDPTAGLGAGALVAGPAGYRARFVPRRVKWLEEEA